MEIFSHASSAFGLLTRACSKSEGKSWTRPPEMCFFVMYLYYPTWVLTLICLSNIQAGTINAMSEVAMQEQIEELVKNIPNVNPAGVFFIAVDGCGGSGKSTVSALLTQALGAQLIHIDDFYKPKKQRVEVTEQTSVHINFEFGRLKRQVLEPLKQGVTVTYQTPREQIIVIKPYSYVIVEGIGTLGTELRDYFDYKIWIDSPEAVRRSRGIKRDSGAWTSIWDNEYLPQDARYVREQSPQDSADWVLKND